MKQTSYRYFCFVCRTDAKFAACETATPSRETVPLGTNRTIGSLWHSCEANDQRLKYDSGTIHQSYCRWKPIATVQNLTASSRVRSRRCGRSFVMIASSGSVWRRDDGLSVGVLLPADSVMCSLTMFASYRLLLCERDAPQRLSEDRRNRIQRAYKARLRSLQRLSRTSTVLCGGESFLGLLIQRGVL